MLDVIYCLSTLSLLFQLDYRIAYVPRVQLLNCHLREREPLHSHLAPGRSIKAVFPGPTTIATHILDDGDIGGTRWL